MVARADLIDFHPDIDALFGFSAAFYQKCQR
jgi:hypothetical protein